MAIHPRQVRLAFGEDPHTPASPAKVIGLVGDQVELLKLDGVAATVQVVDSEAFDSALQRDDLCRLLDTPLALVNERRHLLALAIGPPGPPNKLEVQWGVAISRADLPWRSRARTRACSPRGACSSCEPSRTAARRRTRAEGTAADQPHREPGRRWTRSHQARTWATWRSWRVPSAVQPR